MSSKPSDKTTIPPMEEDPAMTTIEGTDPDSGLDSILLIEDDDEPGTFALWHKGFGRLAATEYTIRGVHEFDSFAGALSVIRSIGHEAHEMGDRTWRVTRRDS